jgi:hypothetical protein
MDGAGMMPRGAMDGTAFVAKEASGCAAEKGRVGEEETGRRTLQPERRASGGHTGGTQCPAAVADE